jgi:alpha-tubulin suppressor-like RCC1 family protein
LFTATALFVSGDPAAVGEVEDGVLLVPTDGNELIIDASAGSGYTLVVLNDGLAAAGGIVGDTYAGHLGLADVVEGIIELTVITNFTDLDGNELAEPPMMSSVKAGVETSVGSGLQHSIFIDVDGNAYASGNNDKGQLCLGDTDSRLTPFQIDLPEPAVYAAVGGDFTLILTESGTVYGCGSNELGQLGLGPDIDSALLPNSGNDLADVLSVSAGLNFALFRTADGIFVTGDNTYGQLCINPETEMLDTPSLIADVDGSAVEMFEAGYQSSYILFGLDDSAAACGLNDVGQLGDNTTVSKSRTAPIIPGKDKIINLGIGASSKSAFFLSDNAIYATGLNDFGQLGIDDGSVTEVSEPTKVVFTTNVTLYNISPGDSQTLYW